MNMLPDMLERMRAVPPPAKFGCAESHRQYKWSRYVENNFDHALEMVRAGGALLKALGGSAVGRAGLRDAGGVAALDALLTALPHPVVVAEMGALKKRLEAQEEERNEYSRTRLQLGRQLCDYFYSALSHAHQSATLLDRKEAALRGLQTAVEASHAKTSTLRAARSRWSQPCACSSHMPLATCLAISSLWARGNGSPAARNSSSAPSGARSVSSSAVPSPPAS